MIERAETTKIGKFQRTHALKGELNAIFDIDPALFLEDGRPVIVEMDGILVPFFLHGVRTKGSTSYLVLIDGVESEESARRFVNKDIYALRADVDDAEAEEAGDGAYAEDFIGYKVIDSDAGELGVVEDLDLTTENALFIVKTPDGETLYIPIADDLIDLYDDKERTITMTLPEGLISINKKSNNHER